MTCIIETAMQLCIENVAIYNFNKIKIIDSCYAIPVAVELHLPDITSGENK